MIDNDKILVALDTDEGTSLLAEFTRLFLKYIRPELGNDENAQKAVMLLVIQDLQQQTVPSGIDTDMYVISYLKVGINDIRKKYFKRCMPLAIAGIVAFFAAYGFYELFGRNQYVSLLALPGIAMFISGLRKKERD